MIRWVPHKLSKDNKAIGVELKRSAKFLSEILVHEDESWSLFKNFGRELYVDPLPGYISKNLRDKGTMRYIWWGKMMLSIGRSSPEFINKLLL